MNSAKNPLGLSTIRSVSSDGLVAVGQRSTLLNYLKSLWGRRHFILADSRAKVAISTRGNLLGLAWLFLNPLFSALAYWFIFGFILQTSRGVPNFVGFLVVGIFFFGYTGKCMTGGTGAIRAGSSLIKGFQFPRAALPISVVLRSFLDFLPTILVMMVVVLAIPPLETVTWRILLVVPIIVMQTLFNIGLACLLARLGHRIPDLSNIMSIVSRFWLYGSGVFFSIENQLKDHPLLLNIMELNPMHAYLLLARDAILYGNDSSPGQWIIGAAWAVGLLIVGFVYFWRGEENYGRH